MTVPEMWTCAECGAEMSGEEDRYHWKFDEGKKVGVPGWSLIRCEACALRDEPPVTPAGMQVKRALAAGLPMAAQHIFWANIQDDVAMGGPVWHRYTTAEIEAMVGAPTMIGEEFAVEEADRLESEGGLEPGIAYYVAQAISEAMGLDGPEPPSTSEMRASFITTSIDEANEHEPPFIEQRARNAIGEIVAVETVPNPRADSCECDFCRPSRDDD